MAKSLGIFGAGGLGREVLDLARRINDFSQEWEQIAFIVDDGYKTVDTVNGAAVFDFSGFCEAYTPEQAAIVIAVGEPKLRAAKHEVVTSRGYNLQTLINTNTFIGADVKIGAGVIIQYGCFISCGVNIGDNVLIQPSANLGHDTVVGRDCVISSFNGISGDCRIGKETYIGVGVMIKEHVSIGDCVIVGMGSAVFRDIPDNVIALGNPARAMKENTEGKVFK